MQLSFRKQDLVFFGLWLAAAFAGRALFDWLIPLLPDAWYLAPLLSGAARGLTQALALARRSHIAALWGLATFMGITFYGWLVTGLQAPLQALAQAAQARDEGTLVLFVILLQAVQGAVIGLWQWAVLRTDAPDAGRWVFFSSIAYAAVGLTALAVFDTPLNEYRDALGTLATGAIGGLGLVWMLNQADDVYATRESGDQAAQ
ncbi:MAG: hypothetical protein HYZ26_09370 [Chloroflexi bacterium]|nr:hypothetical protein [Chloroflexota bacterium]